MKDKKLIITTAIITLAVLVVAFIGFLQTGNSITVQNQQMQKNNENITLIVNLFGSNKTFSYFPTGNASALETLEKNNIVNATNSKYGAFVNCINSVCSGNNYYWMYYINGKSASVGASSYFPKSNDTIEFKYEKE